MSQLNYMHDFACFTLDVYVDVYVQYPMFAHKENI